MEAGRNGVTDGEETDPATAPHRRRRGPELDHHGDYSDDDDGDYDVDQSRQD